MTLSERQEIETEILDLTHDGQGVADVDGCRVFVPGALPEERVVVAPLKRRRRYVEAALVRVVEAAPSRAEPPCEYFGRCGGCALQHMSYAAELGFKQRAVEETLSRIGGLAPSEWLAPIVGPPWRYRRRARLGVKFVEAKQRVLVGFRERAASYITDMASCPVLAPPIDGVIGDLAAVIARTDVKRRLPQAEIAVGERAAAIVLRVLDPPSPADRERLAAFGAAHRIDIHLQPGGPGSVQPLRPPVGRLDYPLSEFDLRLEFSPTDFIQVNAAVNEQMVSAAVELAELRHTDRVLDLFCGLGNFTLPFARRAAEVLGVEGDAGLVSRAVRNAKLNDVPNARFLAADLAEAEWPFYREAWDIVVLDPSRTGAEQPVAELALAGARRIVYVSCHPGTLARDGRTLVESGRYRLRAARVIDMFPHTHHVEAMALFERT